jgi:hypothetical protein
MFLNPDFQVLHPSAHQLQVVSPPVYWVSISLGSMVLPGLLALWRGVAIKSFWVMGISLVWCLGFGLGGWGCSRASWILLDKAEGTVTMDEPGLLFDNLHESIPLGQARLARIATTDTAERIVLVMRDGHYWGFTAYTDQGGQEAAVQAINDFLGVPGG